MQGLLRMEPKERYTARDALFHPYFDGMRSQEEEALCQEYRNQQALRRQESITNTANRNQESSRSRSGMRGNIVVIKPQPGQNFG